mmetsp:Transcript_33274/g.86285  ORF Transcript_33274/g.86285 Transcript_33274/m.86285 type:complete len:217 (+) Transcript_33274:366-1016(+)
MAGMALLRDSDKDLFSLRGSKVSESSAGCLAGSGAGSLLLARELLLLSTRCTGSVGGGGALVLLGWPVGGCCITGMALCLARENVLGVALLGTPVSLPGLLGCCCCCIAGLRLRLPRVRGAKVRLACAPLDSLGGTVAEALVLSIDTRAAMLCRPRQKPAGAPPRFSPAPRADGKGVSLSDSRAFLRSSWRPTMDSKNSCLSASLCMSGFGLSRAS